MQKAQMGDRVRVQYLRLRKPANTSAKPRAPKELEFTVGSSEIIPGVSLGVVGMSPGDRKQFTLSARETNGLVPAGLAWQKPRRIGPQQSEFRGGNQTPTDESAKRPSVRVRTSDTQSNPVLPSRRHSLGDATIDLEVVVLSIDSSAHANKNRRQFDLGGEA